jgi:hypothetical protein
MDLSWQAERQCCWCRASANVGRGSTSPPQNVKIARVVQWLEPIKAQRFDDPDVPGSNLTVGCPTDETV